jgi:ParB family chromosome partitioning protein
LAASLKKQGFLQPITVRYIDADDIYQIITGERRYRASQAAGFKELPCWIKNPKSNEILVHQIAENWHRAQLHPFEIADALAELRDTNGLSQRQLAEETGKDETDISRFLSLLELAPDVQRQAREDRTGSLSARHLMGIARLKPDEQRTMIAAVKEQGLSAVETEAEVRKRIHRKTMGPQRGAPVTKIDFVTNKATVTLVFRKQTPTRQEIVAALDEAKSKAKAAAKKTTLKIHHPKYA